MLMRKFFTHFGRVAPCLFAIVVDYMGFGLVYPLVTMMFSASNIPVFPNLGSVHLKDFYMGLAYLLYPLGMFFGSSFLGDLSDSYGRKKIIQLALGGIVISFTIMASGILAKSVFLFLLGRLVSGLMAGSQPLAQAAIADISSEEDKPWNMALVSLTTCVAIVFGPMIAGIFSEKWFLREVGFSLPFFVAAFVALLTFFWITFGFKETYQPKLKRAIHWLRPIKIFVEGFQNKRVRLIASALLLFQLAVGLYYQNAALFLSTYFHYSSSAIGYFYGFLGLSFVTGTLFVYPFALNRFSIHKICFWGLFLLAIFEVLLCWVKIAWLFWLDVWILATFNILAWTAIQTIFSNCVNADRQGWVMGIFTAMVAMGFVIAGLSANLLPYMGSNWVIFLGGILALLSAALLWLYDRRHPINK